MEEKNSNKFLQGAAVLAVAGLLVKVMGVFFRIPLTNWVGAEGMSYYSSVYPFYTFFLLISLAGIPVAISRMISERTAVKNYGGAHRVFNVSVWLLGGIGFVSFLILHLIFSRGFKGKFLSSVISYICTTALSSLLLYVLSTFVISSSPSPSSFPATQNLSRSPTTVCLCIPTYYGFLLAW